MWKPFKVDKMVIATPFRYDLWTGVDSKEDETIDVHCLVPNGLYVNFRVSSQLTLSDLKEVNMLIESQRNFSIS